MSRTTMALKFKMLWLPNEARYGAVKLSTDINIPSLTPHEDKNFCGSLVLDFRKWKRHVKTIYIKSANHASQDYPCTTLITLLIMTTSLYDELKAWFTEL